jgi:predicted DNA-binding WGR domain protein
MASNQSNAVAKSATMYFEFVDDKSSKFWEVTHDGREVKVRYGKIGTVGQTQLREFDDVIAAKTHYEKMMLDKKAKGYVSRKVGAPSEKASTQISKNNPARAKVAEGDHLTEYLLPVKTTPKVANQVAEAKVLQSVLIEGMKTQFPNVLKPKIKLADSNKRYLLMQVELAAETFDVTFKAMPVSKVDRACNMLSGPFFTSNKHPIPSANGEMLYPIVQLDLRTASEISGERLGDGLLQLWYDINKFDGLIRVVPRDDVVVSEASDFAFKPAQKFDGFPLPFSWNSDPLGENVQVFKALEAKGLASQCRYFEDYLIEISRNEAVPDELWRNFESFGVISSIKTKSIFQLFGSFSLIQYSAADVGKKCLFNIEGDWGSSGNAQVFYAFDEKGAVSFSFWQSLR